MATPKNGYYVNNKRVPGTTTIIGRFKDSGALINWAYNQGKEHEGLRRDGKEAPSHLYDVTQKAADIGTVVHEMVEASNNGQDHNEPLMKLKESEDIEKARSGFGAYQKWASMNNLKIIAQEIPLISKEYRFGGTPDAIGEIDGELCLIDWKTSNGVYQDYLIQLAAYKHLIEEGTDLETDLPLNMTLTGGFHLCRFAKEHGDFAHHYYPDLSEAWEAFKHMRELYELDKALKKRAA